MILIWKSLWVWNDLLFVDEFCKLVELIHNFGKSFGYGDDIDELGCILMILDELMLLDSNLGFISKLLIYVVRKICCWKNPQEHNNFFCQVFDLKNRLDYGMDLFIGSLVILCLLIEISDGSKKNVKSGSKWSKLV